jgi:mono/diheme cytochrome c family protein
MMQSVRIQVLFVVAAFASGLASSQVPATDSHADASRWGMLETYCNECHNATDWAGGVAFDTLTPADVPREGKLWEAAVRKLRGRLMPPPGNEQPDQAQIDSMVGWLETNLDANRETPRAGHVSVQRLNRTEYASVVRSLLGVEIKVQDLLPPEIEVDGFDNIAAALSVSPAFLDQYIGAARVIAKQAVGTSKPKLASSHYTAPGGSQDSYIDGMPLGSRGGMSFTHTFPADGEYRLTVIDLDVGLYPQAAETRHTLVIFIAGREVFRADVGGPEDLALVDRGGASGRAELMKRFTNIPANVKAGTHRIDVTFIERANALSDESVDGAGVFSRLRVSRVLNGIDVSGPFVVTGLSPTVSRQKIFVCTPTAVDEETGCARMITAHLARQAYRRPVTATDIDKLMPFFAFGREQSGDFDGGVQQLVAAVLSSPDFLYRAILPQGNGLGQRGFALSELELASRISFFLWSQGPDDELIEAASHDKLKDPKVYEQQVRRMIADKRSSALVTGFAMRWLNVDDLHAVDPDPRLFPLFNNALRQDFATEIELYLQDILLGDRNVVSLLSADYSFLNERLARHYGIDSVKGVQFRRVTLTDPRRWGLLGKSAVLLRTSYGDRTSPVLRGAWILERMMGTPATPPPPGVETNLSAVEGQKPTTLRVRLEQHRKAQSCNQCHGVIDPLGLALENFDVTGVWRDDDRAAGAAIDASTVLPSGVAVTGPIQLRTELLRRPDQFVQAFTSKLMMYGLGREIEHTDMPQVRAIVKAAAQKDNRFSAIVLGIATSDAFRMQAPPHEAKPAAKEVKPTIAANH